MKLICYTLSLVCLIYSCGKPQELGSDVYHKREVESQLVEKRKRLKVLDEKIRVVEDMVDNQPAEAMCGQIVSDLLDLDKKRKLLISEIENLEKKLDE